MFQLSKTRLLSLVVIIVLGVGVGMTVSNVYRSSASESVLDRKVTPAKTLPRGFLVWNSNRLGNQEIFKMSLPDKKIARLTRHPHPDYFPRISPDGQSIVFSRARHKNVDQGDHMPWDVILLDLKTGKERVLARFGNTPTWSWDGRKVYFQRKVTQFIEHDVASGREQVIIKGGIGRVKAGAGLQTPHFGPDGERTAVTLRYKQHLIGLVDRRGGIQRIADGCQLTWSRRGDFLYFVDYGGRMKNAIYVYQPSQGKPKMWLDLPGKFSHEYFPKLSNDERYLVFGASRSRKAHDFDRADYEIFLWQVGTPVTNAQRLTFNKGSDNWPDLYLFD